jgi:hypothetical protein
VGAIDPEPGVTIAAKVTDWPKREGFAEELTVVVVAMFAGVSKKFWFVKLSPLFRFESVMVPGLKPGADAVNTSVTGPFVAKFSLLPPVNEYVPPAPDVVFCVVRQPLVHVIVALTIAGFPTTLLFTVPLNEVTFPSVNVFPATNPD